MSSSLTKDFNMNAIDFAWIQRVLNYQEKNPSLSFDHAAEKLLAIELEDLFSANKEKIFFINP
jgi:hypothetical protein